MELVFEIIFELIFEGIGEIIQEKKISLWIRVPLMIVFSILFLGISALILYLGIKSIKRNIVAAIICIVIALFLFISYCYFIYKCFKKDVK